jgi:hypothetical protein
VGRSCSGVVGEGGWREGRVKEVISRFEEREDREREDSFGEATNQNTTIVDDSFPVHQRKN